MIVDAHVHLFPTSVLANRRGYLGRDEWFRRLYEPDRARLATTEDLLRSMDAAEVERSVVAGFPWASQELCEDHNACYRELDDERLVRLCTVQPRAGRRAVDELRRCLDVGFAGLGEMNAVSYTHLTLPTILRV